MRLKSLREDRGLLQKEVADILKIKRNTYAMWELEHDIIPLPKLITLAEYYDVAVDYLLGLSDIKKYKDNKKFKKKLYLERLKMVRLENNFTQAMLAEYLNTTNSVISRYEAGITFILTTFLIQYAKIFRVPTDYILGKTEVKEVKIFVK